jgi:hypothetical protein
MRASAVEIGQREIGILELAGFDAAGAGGDRGFTRLEGGAGRGIVLLRICEAHCAGKESATNRGGNPRGAQYGVRICRGGRFHAASNGTKPAPGMCCRSQIIRNAVLIPAQSTELCAVALVRLLENN